MKLKKQILFTFGSFTALIIIAMFFLNYLIIKSSIEKQAYKEIQNITISAYNTTINLLDNSVHSYLRAVTEKNKDIMYFYYNQYLQKKISKKEAVSRIEKLLLSQKIGETGYMVATKQKKDKKIYLVVHPFLKNVACDDNNGVMPCRLWSSKKNQFIEYEWKNPQDNYKRNKVAYVKYFEPFKWSFGATSYKDEFKELINIEDIKRILGSVKIKQSGYIVVFDRSGKFIVHPEFQGKQAQNLKNKNKYKVMQRVFNKKDGFLIYNWKSKNSNIMRKKYAYSKYIKDFNWYLVATGYLDEVLAPVHNVIWLSFGFLLIVAILKLFVVYQFEKSISNPIRKILNDIQKFQEEKLGLDLPMTIPEDISEIRLLARSFNQMRKEIDSYTTLLEKNLKDLELSKNETESLKLYLNNLLDSLSSSIIGIDLEGNIRIFNKTAYDLYKGSKKIIIGENAANVFPFLKEFFPQLLSALRSKKQYVKTKVTIYENNNKKVFMLNAYPILGEQDEGVIRLDDVTEILKLQDMIIHNEKMLSLGGLAAGMAHEINNPLGAIIQGLQNMKRRTDIKLAKNQEVASKLDFSLEKMSSYFEDRNIYTYLNGAEEAAKRAAFIVENMLNFTRKGHNIQSHPDINSIIDKSISLALNDYKMGKDYDIKNIEIIRNYDLHLPAINCIETELEQVFFNLIINCAQALSESKKNEKPKIIITSSFDSVKQMIKILIQDNGPGINEKNTKNIFNPFYTTKDVGKGTGLGLAVVYFIINDHHQGNINVNSSKGMGAEFVIELPVKIK